jgi:hypothetical protein
MVMKWMDAVVPAADQRWRQRAWPTVMLLKAEGRPRWRSPQPLL